MSDHFKKEVFEHYKDLNKLVQKRIPDENMADKAFIYVMEKLAENNWQRVRNYKGKSAFRTYLLSLARHLLEDFLRQEFGRPRPPAWLKAQGSLWIEVYHRLCLERMSVTDVIQSLTIWLLQKRERSVVEEAADVILAKIPDCGKRQEKEEELTDELQNNLTPEEMMIARERVAIIETVRCLLTDTEPSEDNSLRASIIKLRSQIKLSNEERLFLKAVYEEGIKVSKAGRLLGWNANQAHGKHKRLLARIGKAFRKTGLEDETELKSVVFRYKDFI